MFIGADYNECVDDNGGCGQICVNQVAASPQCLCVEGFSLESNGKNCTGMCVCINLKTSPRMMHETFLLFWEGGLVKEGSEVHFKYLVICMQILTNALEIPVIRMQPARILWEVLSAHVMAILKVVD